METPEKTQERVVHKQSTLKGILMGGGIGLLVAVLAYFIGAQMGRSEFQGRLTTATTQVQEAQTQTARSQGIVSLLRARGELYEAAMDLERRNYGSASENLRQADRLLDEVDPARAGVNSAQVESIRTALSATDLTVQSDVGDQRTRVLDLAAQIGDLTSAPSAE